MMFIRMLVIVTLTMMVMIMKYYVNVVAVLS